MQEWAHLAPWIVLPDDHEFIDDYHMGMWNEQVEERIRAWERYTPVAPGSAANLAPGRGGRNFAIDLPGVNWLLVLIDTRSQRSTQIGRGGFPYEWFHRDELFGPQKIMTKQQWQWLEEQMRYARQHNRCLLLVQQGVVGPLVYDTGHNGEHVAVFPGCWDGYASERERLLAMLRRYSLEKTVIIGGDWHIGLSGAFRLRGERQPLAWDFVTTSLSLDCWWYSSVEQAVERSDHWYWCGGNRRGALAVTLERNLAYVEHRYRMGEQHITEI